MKRYRPHLLPLAVWTAVWAVFFGALLAGLARLPNGDFAGQFHAFGLHQARELAAGRLPLWSWGSYAGFPFAADTQAAVFYPPRWLTVGLSLPWGFPYYALELEALLHVWLAGALTYGLALDITGRREAGLLAAVAFGLGGYLVSYPIQQLAILETVAWLPLLLWLIRRSVADGGRPARALTAAGLVYALMISAGHPQSALHAGYLAVAYFVFQATRARWPWGWILRDGLLTGLVAVGASAVAWLPALRYAAETTRTEVGYDFVSSGFPLLDYAQALVPGALTVWSPQYAGLVAFVLALLAWFGRRLPEDAPARGQRLARAEIVFWSAAALAAALLSLGDAGVVFEAAYRLLPGFSLFRQQERLAGVFSLSLALLAAQGLALWLRAAEDRLPAGVPAARKAVLTTGALLVLVGVILAVVQPQMTALPGFFRQWLYFLPAAAILLFGRFRPRPGAWALIALLVLDLAGATRQTTGQVAGPPSAFWPRPDWVEALAADAPGRLDSQNLLSGNFGEVHALEDIRGTSPLKAERVEQYEALPRRLRWQLLNVTHVLARESLEPGMTPLAEAAAGLQPGEVLDATLYRFDDAFPRAWMTYEAQVVPDEAAALAALVAPDFDPARAVVLPAASAAVAAELSAPLRPPVVEIQRDRHGHAIRVATETPGVLVISEWARRGWRATIDGEPAPLLEANGGLLAVAVPAGEHDVEVSYRAPDIRPGAAITLLSLLAAALIILRSKPRPVPAPRRRAAIAATSAAAVAPARPVAAGRRATALAPPWPAVALLLVAFALRVFRLGYQELRGDEAFSYLFTRLSPGGVLAELLSQGDPHPPLHYLALTIWARLTGDSEFALRYLSLLGGLLLVATVFALGRRMGGRAVAAVAGGAAALSPALIWLSQDVRGQYAWMPFFAALATLVLVTAVGSRQRRLWLAYAVSAAATMFTHYYGIFPLLAHGLYVWLSPGRRRNAVAWVASGALALGFLAPWLVVSATGVFGAGHVTDPGRPELARHLVAIGRELVIGPSFPGRAGRWIFAGAAVLVVIGGASLWRGRRPWAAMLLAWLGLAALGTFLIRYTRSTFNPYYLVVAAPAWWLLIAAGLCRLWTSGAWRRWLAAALVAIWLGSAAVALSNTYFDPAYSRSLGYREVAARLEAEAGPDDVLVIPFPDPVWDYALRDDTLRRSLQPGTLGAPEAETTAALAELAASHDRLWFVPYTGSVWDPEDVVGRWLAANLLTESTTTHNRQQLHSYRPPDAIDGLLRPGGQTADGALRLTGSHITVNGVPVDPGAPLVLRGGDEVAVTLVWDALAPTTEALTVFVHLATDAGQVIAQHDGVPADGRRPVPDWQAGQRVLDRHTFTVPPGVSGPARLIAGLYDPVTLTRRPFTGDADAVLLAPARVDP